MFNTGCPRNNLPKTVVYLRRFFTKSDDIFIFEIMLQVLFLKPTVYCRTFSADHFSKTMFYFHQPMTGQDQNTRKRRIASEL